MVASTGAQLLHDAAVKNLCDELLPETFLLTPNIPEAKLIIQKAGRPAIDVQDLNGLKELAASVQSLGPRYVLIKGGHLPLTAEYKAAKSDENNIIVANILIGSDVNEVIEAPYQKSNNTHGTGCSLACTFGKLRLQVRFC